LGCLDEISVPILSLLRILRYRLRSSLLDVIWSQPRSSPEDDLGTKVEERFGRKMYSKRELFGKVTKTTQLRKQRRCQTAPS
jgi:hypothetical protein